MFIKKQNSTEIKSKKPFHRLFVFSGKKNTLLLFFKSKILHFLCLLVTCQSFFTIRVIYHYEALRLPFHFKVDGKLKVFFVLSFFVFFLSDKANFWYLKIISRFFFTFTSHCDAMRGLRIWSWWMRSWCKLEAGGKLSKP